MGAPDAVRAHLPRNPSHLSVTAPSNPQPIAVVEKAIDPRIIVFHSPASREAEQFRGLRNAILAMNPERASRSVAMAAATAGEGLTTTLINLALALSELEGTRVLVLDANLRDPGVERALGLPHQPGLCEVLQERVSLGRAIRPSLFRSVDVLTAGRVPENPAELLAKGRIRAVIDALKPDYSYLLLDTPPVSDFTDASILARECDGAVMVVRLELAPRNAVEQAIVQMRSLGANLLGAFLVGSRTEGPLKPIDAR